MRNVHERKQLVLGLAIGPCARDLIDDMLRRAHLAAMDAQDLCAPKRDTAALLVCGWGACGPGASAAFWPSSTAIYARSPRLAGPEPKAGGCGGGQNARETTLQAAWRPGRRWSDEAAAGPLEHHRGAGGALRAAGAAARAARLRVRGPGTRRDRAHASARRRSGGVPAGADPVERWFRDNPARTIRGCPFAEKAMKSAHLLS